MTMFAKATFYEKKQQETLLSCFLDILDIIHTSYDTNWSALTLQSYSTVSSSSRPFRSACWLYSSSFIYFVMPCFMIITLILKQSRSQSLRYPCPAERETRDSGIRSALDSIHQNHLGRENEL